MAVRQPVLHGSWYPADPQDLALQVDGFLELADPEIKPAGRPWLALSPHAGFAYSGPTAGKLFGLLGDERFQTVILLAPNHRLPLSQLALTSAESFATPLGEVPVDQAAVTWLAGQPGFQLNDDAHAREHAVEIILPFLQRIWPGDDLPAIVPMLVPHLGRAQVLEAAAALGRLRQELTGPSLLLVSSDLTHYGAAFGYQPFTENLEHALEELDSGAILRLLAGKADALLDYGQDTGITMCGLPAAAVALNCGVPAGHEAALIDYARSGDRDGDYRQSVSYASLLISSGQDPK